MTHDDVTFCSNIDMDSLVHYSLIGALSAFRQLVSV